MTSGTIRVEITQHCHHLKAAVCEYDVVEFNQRKIVNVPAGKPKKSGNAYKLTPTQAILYGKPVCKKPFGVTFTPQAATADTITTDNNKFLCRGPTCKNYKVFFKCREDVNECSNDVAGSNACPGGKECVDTYGHFICKCPSNTEWDPTTQKCIDVNQCKCTGDPHCSAYVGKTIDFQGACKYLMTGVCAQATGVSNLKMFNVECRNARCGKPEKLVTCTKYCDVTIYKNKGSNSGPRTVVRLARNGVVKINGNDLSNNVYEQDGIKVKKTGKASSVVTDFDLSVSFDGRSKIYVNTPDSYIGKMCGICGDIGLQVGSSFKLPSGSIFSPSFKSGKRSNRFTKTSADTYGNAWQVNDPEDPNCAVSPTGEGVCSPQQQVIVDAACAKLRDVFNAFQAETTNVLANTTLDEVLTECKEDGCAYDEDEIDGMVCSKAELLAMKLYELTGIRTAEWRSEEFCDLGCAEDEEISYFAKCDKECGMNTLADAATCTGVPTDRCVCAGNKFRLGTDCVAVGDCGCDLDPGSSGKTFRLNVGEQSLDADCQNYVICGSDGKITQLGAVIWLPNFVCDTTGDRPTLTCRDGFELDGTVCIDKRDCGDFERVNGDCILQPEDDKSWRTAIQSCAAEGGRFLQLLTQGDIDNFKTIPAVANAPAGTEFYIAGLNIRSLDELQFSDPGFENYRLPLGFNSSENIPGTFSYLCYTFDSINGIQPQTDCEEKRRFICEKILPEEKTTDFGPCSGSQPSSRGDERETTLGIIENDPLCMCSQPMDIECSPNTNNYASCAATPEGLLSTCIGGEQSSGSCEDTMISGKCEPNVDECSSGWNLCPSSTTCEDRWGSFQCVCNDRSILIDGECIPLQPCQLDFVPGTDEVEVKIITFNNEPFASDVGACEVPLVDDCSGSVSVKWSRSSTPRTDVLTTIINGREINITRIDSGIVAAVDGVEVGTSTYPDFSLERGPMYSITTTDNQLFISIAQDLTVQLVTTYTCGSCAGTTVDEVFKPGQCSAPDSGPGDPSDPTNPPPGGGAPSTPTPPPSPGPSEPPNQPTPPPSATPGPENPPPPVTQPPQPTPPPPTPPPPPMSTPEGPGAAVPTPVPTTKPPPPPPGTPSTTPAPPPPTPTPPPQNTCQTSMDDADKCGIISASDGPFAGCENQGDLMMMCIEQTCTLDKDLCEALDMAVNSCNGMLTAGNKADFRRKTGCFPDCPVFMEYSLNPPTIIPTCSNKLPNMANEPGLPPRAPQCVCVSGYYLQDDKCIPSSECGCKDPNSDRYYKNKETWYNDDCTKLSTCKAGGVVVVDYSLPPNSVCGVKDDRPVVVCAPGYLGDPNVECKKGEDDGSGLCATISDGVDNIRKCICNKGYVSDCETCVDLDECQSNNHECKANEKCVNSPGSYNCDCKPGYERSLLGVCKNINECQRGGSQPVCPPNSMCEDLPGSYTCRCCLGYKASLGLHGVECIRDSRYPVVSNDCCLCTTNQCKPPTNGSPAKVCGSDGRTYKNYKELYEVNCLRFGEANINVTVVNYGECQNANEQSTPSTTTTPAPTTVDVCSSDLICSIDETLSGGCCSGNQYFVNVCDLRVHNCRKGGHNPTRLPVFVIGTCVPRPTTTTTPEPTPSPNDFTPWGPWSNCLPRPGSLGCGTANGIKIRTRKYTGNDEYLITSEMVREEDSCDLPTCATETENPVISCNFAGCPKHDDKFCGRIVDIDSKPQTYGSRCHLERSAECYGKPVSFHRNEYYPGECSPDGKRPSSFPCQRGPFTTTARYSAQSAKTGQTCTSEVFTVAECNEGVCDAGSSEDVCCRPDRVEVKKVNVVCTNNAGLKQTVVKEVITALSCRCAKKDADDA